VAVSFSGYPGSDQHFLKLECQDLCWLHRISGTGFSLFAFDFCFSLLAFIVTVVNRLKSKENRLKPVPLSSQFPYPMDNRERTR